MPGYRKQRDAVVSDAGKRKRRKKAALARYLRQKAGARLAMGRRALTQLARMSELKDEIRLLTSYSTDTIYRLRYDSMRYDYVSPSVIKLLGYSSEEMKRINIRSLILETRIVTDAMKPVASFDVLEESRRRGEVSKWQADYLIRTKDGRKVWVSDISYPWYDEKGAIIGSVGSLRDITDRIEAETRAKEEIARVLRSDALTGMATRRIFFTKLEEELKRIKRSRDDLALLLIDIDNFRKINDTYGQSVGDHVLQEVARIVASCLRETDLGARIGGEEFGALLIDTGAEGAFWVAERIRMSVSKHVFHAEPQQRPFSCTVSIGVAGARFDQNLDAEQLYKSADGRLFIAKHTGRNQVSMDELVEIH